MKLMECIESNEDPLIKVVRTHRHHTNSVLLETVKNCMKYFQSETKQIKKKHNRSERKKWVEERMHEEFPRSLDENWGIRNTPIYC
jgi:hypothetical protein